MKKLLLGLGAIASVAAPVAAVVACSNDNGTTDPYKTQNDEIAKVLNDHATQQLDGGPITAQASESFGNIATEGELKRDIKVVTSGYKVEFTYLSGAKEEFYFASNDESAINAEKIKLNAEAKGLDDITVGTPVAITTPFVTYTDITCSGAVFAYDASTLSLFNKMNSVTFSAIKDLVDAFVTSQTATA